ncbi:cytochrome c oxidase accessory protein CcoG [Thalassotalea sp. G2M2-11]|uniref:cytochrome c oxidase accessory protein CcoG n=1 Tax=Thalassotalea sp. G2M2-11 TaxID=2787627 RepID=UPI0019CFF880
MSASYQSKENLIFKTPYTGDKIYIREQFGRYQKIRRYLSVVLVLIFAMIPLIEFQGKQAVYFDLQQQKIQLFSMTLFPQDFLIFCLLFTLAAFLLFYVTKLYGRVWCGFTCPQTIWMLAFNWIERRIEGSHNQSKSLDKQKLSWHKVSKKLVKHFLWLSVSLLTALIFISYFVPAKALYLSFFTGQQSSLVVYWGLFFTGCTYINAGWIREKMCQHICPYSRFQSAMFDKSTTMVSYDVARGENRAKRKRSQVKQSGQGDCVDCHLCVQVCPVGIDIRDGLQFECINCGLCADACDMTMEKFNAPKGLISFYQESSLQRRWLRHLAYGSLVLVLLLSIIVWLNSWQSFQVNIIRDRQELFRINEQANVENLYIVKIRNKTMNKQQYQLAVHGLSELTIENNRPVDVLAGELRVISVTVSRKEATDEFRNDIEFTIKEQSSQEVISKESSFYSGGRG